MAFAATTRSGSYIETSGFLKDSLPPDPQLRSLTVAVGILFDLVFVEPSRTKPCEAFYCRLKAARDVLYDNWIRYPRSHYREGTLSLVSLGNILGLLDIRFFNLRKSSNARGLSEPLPCRIFELFSRPRTRIHADWLPHLVNFLGPQAAGIFGRDCSSHFTYLTLAQSNGYVGRTGGVRVRAGRNVSAFQEDGQNMLENSKNISDGPSRSRERGEGM